MTKKQTAYSRLLDEFREYYNAVKYPRMKLMWRYTRRNLSDSWVLSDLYQRVAAAEQIGYEVVLKAEDEGLSVWYRKKPPTLFKFS